MNKLIILALVVMTVSSFNLNFGAFKDFKGINIEECIKDVSMIVKDLTTTVQQLRNNPMNIQTDVADLVRIFQDIQYSLPDCGINMDLAPITTEIFAGIRSQGCLADIEQLVSTLQQTVTDAQNKNLSSLIQDVIAVVNQVKATLSDCKVVTEKNLLSASMDSVNATMCMTHVTDIVRVVEKFFTEDNTVIDYNHAITHAFNTLTTSMTVLSAECGLGFVQTMVNEQAPAACISALMNLAKNGSELAKAFSNGQFDFLKAFGPISTIMGSFDTIKAECPFVSKVYDAVQVVKIATA